MTGESKKSKEEESAKETEDSQQRNVFEEFGDQVGKFASRTMDSIRKSIDKALISRNTVLTIRVNDAANEKLTMLVDAGIFKSRSESAAFLIEEGIKHQETLFQKISKKLGQITKLKDELKDIVINEFVDDSSKKKQSS